ncbi:hypothetical protein OROHE_021525 [Orobanche hederae]
MPAESVSVGRDEVLPAANSSIAAPDFNNGSWCSVYVGPLSALCVGCVYRLVDRSQSGLNGTNSMEMKTTEKRSLLAGAIFYDNSGESSVDENETAHLSGSTGSQSDSSSMSDYSVGESNLSHDSIRNGSSDAKKKIFWKERQIKVRVLTCLPFDLRP